LAVSAALAAAASTRSARLIAWLWAPLVGLAVVATGNHFIFDIAAGAIATGVGFALARASRRLSVRPARLRATTAPAAAHGG
jgi:membrane-associated phospholipid phosphatase